MQSVMPFRTEIDLVDCEVDGRIPDDLNGAFYRVGPDFQYPPKFPDNIPFDGEGHVSMFRFSAGRVDLKSRYVRTQRFDVQRRARRALFGMYRNPFTDDAGLENVSRGTANTTVVYHAGRLLALKEDSPPVAMDALTLDTKDDYVTFGGKLTSQTFTAHPKLDPETGEMIAFGYEARGLGSDDVAIVTIDRDGNLTRESWIKVPYVGMLHDFAVTQSHIAFLAIPMAFNLAQMKAGGVHFAWDSTLPSWFGVMRRHGDGSDLRWYKGPERCATHVMGAWSDGDRCYVDMDMARKNQFPFFPNLHGERFDPVGAAGRVTRLSVDLSKKSDTYDMQVLYPDNGVLPRQDDRYQTIPYRYGFMPTVDLSVPPHPAVAGRPFRPNNCYTKFDHATARTQTYHAGDTVALQECCFAPRRPDAPEGDGYILGMAEQLLECSRSDLLILDTADLGAGPVATVRLPFRIFGQVHGCWVADEALPGT
jgi:carotenoid cleavage dioxygenase